MSWITSLKLLWKNRSAIKEAGKAIEAIKEANVKTGWKTTEFWMTIMTNVVTVVQALNGVIPPETAAIILAVANGLYGVLRTITKKV